ncbi:uncharacterized protein BJ171DRAFT_495365 [Polychytrium aggregatum]|uniref:uncharacterized protein n=1 Tax=Polychytrium aggregatum TaxID=110093 RepID=UPI0022FE823C|nr:uncharacterized protein BJ171DRAFT_495365 [Polychytrium aggregatum]KAI9206979.1 hypothetical protein BJ171DRAFT_495365 [Polychytrium aggregatum]
MRCCWLLMSMVATVGSVADDVRVVDVVRAADIVVDVVDVVNVANAVAMEWYIHHAARQRAACAGVADTADRCRERTASLGGSRYRCTQQMHSADAIGAAGFWCAEGPGGYASYPQICV